MELIIQRANNIPQVQNFSVTAENDGNITVSWEAGEDSDSVVPAITGYRIYRTDEDGNEVLAATVEDETSWSDTSAVSGETFSYLVCAVDSHGREGVSSDSKKVTVPKDTEAPVITPTVADQSHYTEYITVDLNATDNREVNSVRLYVKYPDSEKFVLDGTNYSDTYWFNYWPDEEVDGVLKLKVEAYDKSGNVTTEIYAYYQDFTAPDAVAKAETSAEKTRELTVSWEASASDDVKKYLVTLGKTTEEIEASAEREVTFTDLEYDTDYEISIVAEDMVGFQSEALTVTGHTPENPAPVVTLSSPKEGETYHETVSCTVSSEDDYYIDIVGIEFSADGETWESQTSWKAYGPTNSKTVSPYLTQYRSYESIYVRAYVVDTEGSRSETDPVKIYLDYEGPVLDESSFTAEYYSPYLHVSFAQSEDEDASYYELYYGNSSGWTKRATFQHDADNPGQVFTYADSSATFGEKNSYSVYAYDIYGNRTGMGKEFLAYTYEEPTIGQITVVDSPYETTIGGIYNTVTSTISYPDHGSTRIGELTEATYSYVGFDGQTYRVDADVTTVTTGGKLTAALDIDTLKDTTELTLTLKDSAGNTYTKGQTLTLETEQPEEVYGLYVYSSETTIYLNWTIATEVSSTGYRIYRKVDDGDFELYKTISGREKISYEDTDVVEDVTYSYYMTVVSEMGVESDPCLTLSAQLVTDTEAPTITLNPVSGQTFGSYIRITGTANDNVAVKAIRLYKVNGDEEELLVEKQGNTISYKYEPADDVEEGTIVIRGEAEDGKGLKTSVERTYTLDRTGPEQVVNLTYSVTATTAVINWDDVSDNDFAYFSLEKFNPDTAEYEEIKQIKNYRGVSLSGLEPETTYVYRVVAYDLYGNRGTASDAVVIQTTADTTSPVITNIAPSATYYNGDFTVKYTAWDDVGITSMTVQYSKDSASWTDLETFEYEDGATEKTCSYTFNAADYEDGTFYTRAITLVVKEEEIVTGTFEVNRMTLSEIQAAGIDVANPANQNVVKADVTIYYGSQKVEMTCYSGGGVSSGSSVVIKTESGERKLIAQPVKKTSKGTGAGQSDDETTVDAVVVMDVPVQASCLKEFFDVKLHIFNNATQDFTLINNAVQLDVPDGLTIVRANNTAQGAYVSFDELKGQEQKTLSWIMRGDKEGEYDLTADYYALLQEFDAEISATFKTEEPIKVYGLSNMQLVVQVNQQLLYNTAYFAIGLRNQGSTDVLCPTIDIAEEVMQVAALTGVKDREFDLEMLEQRVSNNYGFSQVVTGAPSVLAGGEMYAKKYAVYGAALDTDVGSLQEVIVRLAEEYGIEVVVEVVNMDLYNGEDAEAKVENMLNGSSSHAYEYLTTDKNFAYYLSYGYAQEDVSDEIYDFGQIFFNANLDSITGYEKEELIKKMMAEMLSHEDIQKNVQAQVDTAYIDVAKKTLSNIKTATSLLSNEGKSQLDVMLSDTSSIKKLAEELKINGSGGMFEATAYLAGSLGLSALKSELMSAGSGEFCSLAAKELTSQLGEASDIIGVVSEVVSNWNDAAESVNLLMNMQYSYAESMNILNSLVASEDETIRKVANVQITKLENHRASMVQEYTELWAKGLVDKTASGVQSSLKKVFAEKTAGKVYGWACVIYKFEDSVAGWSKTYTAQEKAVVAAQMSDAFMQTLNNTEDASTKLQALRYVIEMRFIGERNFTELLRRAYAKEGYSDEEIDKMVITWYDNQVMKISKYRDEIYQTEATTLNVPAAPTVTIDYENCCTKESFSSDYEYSFNNDTWITCSGDTISFIPKVYNASLYVRVKGNSEHVAGTIRVVSLPAIRKLDVEARVLYYDGEYTIKGLTAGEHYQYVLTNEESVDSETLEWPSGAIAEDDGTITISSTEAYDYLVLRLAATNTKIASQYKTFTVKKVTQVAAPKANVASGDVQYGRRITLSCSTPNAIIYYTTDGSQPTKDSAQWTPYTKILITGSTVIKAMASIPEDEGYHDSAVVTYQWKVKKQNQSISVRKSSYSLVYGKQTFLLYATAKTKLYYRTSNSKVVTVSSAGKVTVKGYGTATITIAATATGAYNSATRTVTITVKPTRKTLKSVTAGKKKLTVKFTKDTKASGYQLQYSTSSKFAASKTKTLKLGKNTTSRTIKNLKSGKRYYVRIRSYTTVGGKTVYGSWSKVAYRTVK